PATSSFVSVKGPSITVRFPPENLTREPFELGCSPSPASITPALTSSSLNFPISVRIFLLGRTPASESLFALTSTMNRIVVSPFDVLPAHSGLYLHVERAKWKSTHGSCLSIARPERVEGRARGSTSTS